MLFPHIFFGKGGYSFTEYRNSEIILNFLPGKHSSLTAGYFSFLKQAYSLRKGRAQIRSLGS